MHCLRVINHSAVAQALFKIFKNTGPQMDADKSIMTLSF